MYEIDDHIFAAETSNVTKTALTDKLVKITVILDQVEILCCADLW